MRLPGSCVAVAAVAAFVGFSDEAAAETASVRLIAHVPTRCAGGMVLQDGVGEVREGVITTNCNTRYTMNLSYLPSLGRIEVDYDGALSRGADGLATLREDSPPTISATAFRLRFLDQVPQAVNGFFSLTLSPRGL